MILNEVLIQHFIQPLNEFRPMCSFKIKIYGRRVFLPPHLPSVFYIVTIFIIAQRFLNLLQILLIFEREAEQKSLTLPPSHTVK